MKYCCRHSCYCLSFFTSVSESDSSTKVHSLAGGYKSICLVIPSTHLCVQFSFFPSLALSTRVLGSTVWKGFHMSLFMTAACGAGLHTVSCLLLWNGLLPSRALHVATLGWMVQMCSILYHFEICDITWCAENWVLRGVYADETEYGFLANHSLYYRQLTDQQCKL